jgi:hypothetical protein
MATSARQQKGRFCGYFSRAVVSDLRSPLGDIVSRGLFGASVYRTVRTVLRSRPAIPAQTLPGVYRFVRRWRVFYGDVQVGTIGVCAGVTVDADPWAWTCGFYPFSNRGRHEHGAASDLFKAHAAF